MKYLVTELGFIDRLVRPGEIIEIAGPPPIGGLVPVDEPEPVVERPADPVVERPKRTRSAKAGPSVDDEADII